MITICLCVKNERLILFNEFKQGEDFTAFVFVGINSGNQDFIKIFVRFLVSILENSVREGSLEVIT